ncbi:multiple sugar transport system permease protein [Kribbella aluminosa]|uniref:Multiple sugar transport system permease protein n=1 Tax=Kribbella aluminosa TaxID=416017 RepID=A0ABS4UTT5_9ACTN|nr:sugar ABC transporter permease [Kribbella aluminosa]MBP2355042.1 multiple sugar transport system permease protein [Kribbella aluminosa]
MIARLRQSIPAYLFLLPWLIGIIGLTIGPMLLSLYYSFTDYALLNTPEWQGLHNYTALFHDSRYLQSLKVTFIYVGVSVPLEMAFALAVAVLLNRGLKGLAVYRALYYVPSLLGGSVAIALLWQQIFGSDGLLNDVLGLFGIHGRGWISEPGTALWTLIVLRVWQFGAPMVIFLAGLRQIPDEVLEAAEVDGAGRWQRFWRVTLPLLSPVVFFNLVLQIIGAFQAFTPAFVISGGKGGPSDSTLFYTLYLYQQAFGNFKMGYAAAMAWVLLLIVAVFTGLNFVLGRAWVFYGDEGVRR